MEAQMRRYSIPTAAAQAARAVLLWLKSPPSVGPGVHTVTLSNDVTFVVASDGADARAVRQRTGIKPLIGGD